MTVGRHADEVVLLAEQEAVGLQAATRRSATLSVHSDTGAASALYERYREHLDEFVAGVEAAPGQIGAAFLVNGRFAGLDLLGGPDVLVCLLPKLVRSYALDAMDGQEEEARDVPPTGQGDACHSKGPGGCRGDDRSSSSGDRTWP